MNRTQLIDRIAEETKYSKTKINKMMSSMLDIITDTLANGEDVKISLFGSFSPQIRKGHKIYDIQSKQHREVATIGTVKFRPSEYLKTDCTENMKNWDKYKKLADTESTPKRRSRKKKS